MEHISLEARDLTIKQSNKITRTKLVAGRQPLVKGGLHGMATGNLLF